MVCCDTQNPFCLLKVELGFRSGDIIYVLGDMDQDGFYYVSVHFKMKVKQFVLEVLALNSAQKCNFHFKFRGICTDGEVWFHQITCRRYPGIRRKRQRPPKAPRRISSFYLKIMYFFKRKIVS